MRASFDDTEGRWGSRERHIEGRYRLGETLQRQAAEVFECNYFLYGCGDATGDQDLAILCPSTEPLVPLRLGIGHLVSADEQRLPRFTSTEKVLFRCQPAPTVLGLERTVRR